MAYNKELLDDFLKGMLPAPKTNQEARIDLLKETNRAHQQRELLKDANEGDVSKEIPLSQTAGNSPVQKTMLSVSQPRDIVQGVTQKNLSPFFMGMSVFLLVIIAFLYYKQVQKVNKQEEARNERVESDRDQNSSETKDLADTILNSGTAKSAKKILILLATIFVMVLIVYSFNLLFRQVKNVEATVMS